MLLLNLDIRSLNRKSLKASRPTMDVLTDPAALIGDVKAVAGTFLDFISTSYASLKKDVLIGSTCIEPLISSMASRDLSGCPSKLILLSELFV